MGRPKALLDYKGETFVGRLVRILSRFCDPVIVVAGVHAAEIRAHVAANVVVNPDPDRGQLSSLQTALRALPAEVEGFVFTPVDSPSVGEETLAQLIEIFKTREDAIVIPKFEGRRGHPVFVPGSLAADFLALAPTEETRAVINRNAGRIVYVDVDDRGILADIDDPAAYRALVQ